MEVMEDGNLMDKVNILIQRDMEYYKAHQCILQETICTGVIGGKLDFPRSASFAAVKLVTWWEDEFVAAHRKQSGFLQKEQEGLHDNAETSGACGGIVRASDPAKFVTALGKSADQLMEHLHVLTQEALDHADLTVLTGTIGAAALLKNSLWFYMQMLNDVKSLSLSPLQNAYKKYNEMCEALAERLLDMHCRLLSLYILQDADCLDWESDKPFFESERGSYIIQMWWLYMQGTREDLWTSVPPKMAQRVFSGMLNESLTILTVRYTQCSPSEARSYLLLVDVSNLLLCVAQLLPAICGSMKEFIGEKDTTSKILRDIHVKCQELYFCFLLRGAPLDLLHKTFKKGLDKVALFEPKSSGPAAWIVFCLPNIFKDGSQLSPEGALALELMVVLSQPQPDWALFLKLLCSNNFKILRTLFNDFLSKFHGELRRARPKSLDCGKFLCVVDGSCEIQETIDVGSNTILSQRHYYELLISTTEVFLHIANDVELKQYLVDEIIKQPQWAKCFDRRNVWNQIRSPWYEVILNVVAPILPLITDTVISALQTGATMYQAMALVVACFSQYWDAFESRLSKIVNLFQEVIPSDVKPLGGSALLQVLVSALYSSLITIPDNVSSKKRVSFQHADELKRDKNKDSIESVYNTALAVGEALCSIDEDNKHTDQIAEFLLEVANKNVTEKSTSFFASGGSARVEADKQLAELLVSDLLMTTQGKKSLKTLYHFIKNNSEWLYWKLGASERVEETPPNRAWRAPDPLLHKMFHIGYRSFDQLLTKQLQPNWQQLLQKSSGCTQEKASMQILRRWEFKQPDSSRLSGNEVEIVNSLSTILKQ